MANTKNPVSRLLPPSQLSQRCFSVNQFYLEMAPRHLPRFSNLIRVPYGRSIRSISTVVGQSGRVYTTGEVLQHHREDHNLSVFKAE